MSKYKTKANREARPIPEEKTCTCCKETKPIKDFAVKKNPTNSDTIYFYPTCRKCMNKKRSDRRYKKDPKWNKEKGKDYKYRAKYGITLEDYYEMYSKQEGCCLLCGDFYESLAVDHCHDTGKVRGLLCSCCNGGLGLFRDNTKFLEAAIMYLRITGTDKSSSS